MNTYVVLIIMKQESVLRCLNNIIIKQQNILGTVSQNNKITGKMKILYLYLIDQ